MAATEPAAADGAGHGPTPAGILQLGLGFWASKTLLSLEERRFMLGKIHDALPPGGAVIVFEAIIDDDRRENAFGLLMSLNMLIETPAGADYTGADCQGWMRDAGFAETYVEHLVGPESMVVGVKAG